MMLLGVLFLLAPVYSQYVNVTEKKSNILSNPCADKNHLVLAPGVLTAGGSNRACVSRFFPEGPARVLLTLFTEDRQSTTVSRDLPPGDGGCLDINVPQLPNTKADLMVNIRYPEAQCVWERRLQLRIASGRVLVVQTERVRYRPGDTVRARILALKPDLAPSHGMIEEAWLEGPRGAWEGTRVSQWLRLRTRLGLAQLQYQLDVLAPPGKWTLRARLGDGSQSSAVFWVGNYELPPFQLSVRHAPRVLRTSERLAWTVCVRYPWSEAVEGMLVIRLRGAGRGGAGVRTAVRLRAPKACHRHAVAARRVGLHDHNPPDVLVADFSFQEEGTRIWQNTTVVSQVVDKPLTLEFLTKHRAVISPGLPYKLKVKATRWDDKPAPGEAVRVCRHPTQVPHELAAVTSHDQCAAADTDANGVARVMFAAVRDVSAFYRFEARLANDSSTVASLTVRVRSGAVQAALGPLRPDARSSRTLVPLYINTHVTTPLAVHFVVITRGGIIYRWGATTQCPTSNTGDQIHTAPRNGKCNANYYGYNRDVMAQQDNVASYDDIALKKASHTRRRRNLNTISKDSKTKIDPNSIQLEPTIDPWDFSERSYSATGDWISPDIPYQEKEHAQLSTPKNRIETDSVDIYKKLTTSQWAKSHKSSSISSQLYTRITPQDGLANAYWTNPFQNDVNPHKKEKYTTKVDDVVDNVTNLTSDALLDRKLKVMLPIKVSHQMCPDSHLIAYFYYNGELVSASKHFEMDECFANKVETTWLTRQALPGSTVSLQVSTPGPALCALTVLDTAAKWNQPPTTTKELLMEKLRRVIDSHRNLTEYDAAGECFLNSDDPETPTTSIELTSSWLASAGVRLLGGEAPRDAAKHCEALPPASLVTDEAVPRSDFSEAWLWRLMLIGVNGSGVVSAQAPDSITKFEAGATCVSRSGVAVSQPAVLQVFREFFIHADGPKRLRRGDTAIIRYRIFNYLYESLSVQIQILTDPHIEAPIELVETACIGARSSVARRTLVKARVASPARLSLRAKAVNDGNCPNVTSNASVSDEVIIHISVDPEGVPIHEQKSILLCGNGSSTDFSSSQVDWSWPPVRAVPGTETLTLWVVGDATGPLLADADSLVLIPRGCGEQNMAQLATNLLALQQLHPSSTAALTAKEHVARGFTRQLQYIHPSGGFSAFGASDATSSTWLTAFAVRHMRKAHQLLWPNLQIPAALIRAERWLVNQQMENGCFANEGQVFHRELRGGLNEEGEIASVALTAYVITSLIESTYPLPYRVLRNTLSCLRALPPLKSASPTRVYAHALLAYTFMRLDQYEQDLRKTNKVSLLKNVGLDEDEGVKHVMELLNVARRTGGYVWWEASSLSTSIEATSYTLLAVRASPASVTSRGAGADAAAALRWLAAHRSVGGGFVSTQDTLVALEALIAWSSSSPPTQLKVTVRCDNRTQTVNLLPDVKIPEVVKIAPGDHLSVGVTGSGCALVQATRSYNSMSTVKSPAQERLLSVQVAVHSDGPFDCDNNQTSCFCAAVIEACVMWSSSFPEMALLEVSLPGGYGADAQLLYEQLHTPGSLLRRIELTPTNTRATFYLGTQDGSSTGDSGGHQCYSIHAVGPRTKTRPAYVRVQDYYSPEHNDTQLFTIPEDCPPRISHDAPEYHTSDNLFTKARSLNGDDIVITHEFAFEDIPEGIPLEDPLYDNLTRKEKYIERSTENKNIEKPDDNESKNKNVFNVLDIINLYDNINLEDINHKTNQYGRGHLDAYTTSDVPETQPNTPDQSKLHNEEQNNDLKIITNQLVNKENDIKRSFEENTSTAQPVLSIIISEPIRTPPNINNKGMQNPSLADFHVIDSEKDLDVPTGIEGPIPTVVLPPANYVPPPLGDDKKFKTLETRQGPYMYFEPENIDRRYFIPKQVIRNGKNHRYK